MHFPSDRELIFTMKVDKDKIVISFVFHMTAIDHKFPVDIFYAKSDLSGFAESFGFSQFAYARSISGGAFAEGAAVLSNYSNEWRDAYLLEGVGALDPVLRENFSHGRLFSWGELQKRSASSEKFFQLSQEHGITPVGFSVPIRSGPRHWSLLSVTTGDKKPPSAKAMEALEDRARRLALEFHNDIFPGYARAGKFAGLSKREREVLYWAALGKTSWETGAILGLKEQSINGYLRNACSKLEAANKTAAVAAAIRAGLI